MIIGQLLEEGSCSHSLAPAKPKAVGAGLGCWMLGCWMLG